MKKYLKAHTFFFVALSLIPTFTNAVTEKSFISKDFISPESSFLLILLFAFLTGILVSFTPCIYPMIPITVGILQAQASRSIFHNFLTATSYVIGISVIYSTLGYVAATTTLIFGQWLANPWLIFLLILLFLYFAFSMFGFYEIYMPAFLKGQQGTSPKGSLIYSFLFGMISGAAVSPCLTPALALLLGLVAKLGSPILGFFTLFAFSLGMGTLLILIGTFSNTAFLMPKAGSWMVEIKKLFGFALIGVCAYFLQPLLPQTTIMALYALVALAAAGYHLFSKPRNPLKMALGAASLILTIFFFMKIF